jgi:hypothetical protein
MDDYSGDEVAMNIYYVFEPVGEPTPDPGNKEVSELRWFAPEELPLDEISFPGHCREVLEAWRRTAG